MKYGLLSLVSAIAFVGGPAFAATFVSIATGDYGTTYVDIDSAKVRHGRLSVWTMDNYDEPSRGVLSNKTLWAVNCQAEEIGVVSVTDYSEYSGNGRVVTSMVNTPTQLRLDPVSPDTLGEQVAKVACYIQSTGTLEGFDPIIDSFLSMKLADIKREQAEEAELKSATPEQIAAKCSMARYFLEQPSTYSRPYDAWEQRERYRYQVARYCR